MSSLSYSERDQPALIRYGNDTQTAYTYYGKEQNFRLQRIRSGTGTGTDVLQDLRYEYDRKGNVTHLEDGGEGLAFSYDALDRLTGTSGTYSETYQYDETGNLKSKGDVGYGYNPAGADLLPPPPPPPLPYRTYLVMLMGNGPYAYPPANDGQPHAVISDTQGFQASYDANGNMTLRLENGTTYQQGWDEENRLTVVTDTTHSAVTRFSYDGLGALVRKELQEGAGITTTLYLGNTYERVLGEAPQETWYYYAGAQRVAVRAGGTLHYLYSDHLGSSRVSATGGSKENEQSTPPTAPTVRAAAAACPPTTASPGNGRTVTLTCTGWAQGGTIVILTGGSSRIQL